MPDAQRAAARLVVPRRFSLFRFGGKGISIRDTNFRKMIGGSDNYLVKALSLPHGNDAHLFQLTECDDAICEAY